MEGVLLLFRGDTVGKERGSMGKYGVSLTLFSLEGDVFKSAPRDRLHSLPSLSKEWLGLRLSERGWRLADMPYEG